MTSRGRNWSRTLDIVIFWPQLGLDWLPCMLLVIVKPDKAAYEMTEQAGVGVKMSCPAPTWPHFCYVMVAFWEMKP